MHKEFFVIYKPSFSQIIEAKEYAEYIGSGSGNIQSVDVEAGRLAEIITHAALKYPHIWSGEQYKEDAYRKSQYAGADFQVNMNDSIVTLSIKSSLLGGRVKQPDDGNILFTKSNGKCDYLIQTFYDQPANAFYFAYCISKQKVDDVIHRNNAFSSRNLVTWENDRALYINNMQADCNDALSELFTSNV